MEHTHTRVGFFQLGCCRVRAEGGKEAERDLFKRRQPLQIYKVPSKALTAEAAERSGRSQSVPKAREEAGTGKATCLSKSCPTAASAEAGPQTGRPGQSRQEARHFSFPLFGLLEILKK